MAFDTQKVVVQEPEDLAPLRAEAVRLQAFIGENPTLEARNTELKAENALLETVHAGFLAKSQDTDALEKRAIEAGKVIALANAIDLTAKETKDKELDSSIESKEKVLEGLASVIEEAKALVKAAKLESASEIATIKASTETASGILAGINEEITQATARKESIMGNIVAKKISLQELEDKKTAKEAEFKTASEEMDAKLAGKQAEITKAQDTLDSLSPLLDQKAKDDLAAAKKKLQDDYDAKLLALQIREGEVTTRESWIAERTVSQKEFQVELNRRMAELK